MALQSLCFFFTFLHVICFCAAWNHEIQISSRAGTDSPSCLTNFSIPCRSLAFVLDNELNSSTFLVMENGVYELVKTYIIKDKENISINGLDGVARIKCRSKSSSNGSGISWIRTQDIELRDLDFEKCSFKNKMPKLDSNSTFYYFYGGMVFTYCTNIFIQRCSFKNSTGIGVAMFDCRGSNKVLHSTFRGNGLWSSMYDIGVHRSGGGLLICITRYGILYPDNSSSHEKYTSNNTYDLIGSSFQMNQYRYELMEYDASSSIFGWGGGLTILVYGAAQNNTFLVNSCWFEHNKGEWGGGLFAEFHDKVQDNTVSIINSTFKGNKAKFGGGGIRTGNNIITRQYEKLKGNKIENSWNKLYHNEAELGGGISHYGWTYNQYFPGDNRKTCFSNCFFKGNRAIMGSAISVALNNKNNWTETGDEIPYTVQLENCTVKNNIPIKDKVAGMGAVYVSRVPIILYGSNNFTGNNNTAFLLDNASLKVFGNVYFVHNQGFSGGALAFYGEARLVLTKKSYILFRHNTALQRGGAWYVRTPGPEIMPFNTTKLRRHFCFIAYDDEGLIEINELDKWQTKLEFHGNSAPPFNGNSIYATTLQSCYLLGEGSRNNKAFEWNQIITYTNVENVEDEISTDPVAIEFIQEEWSNPPYEQFNATIHLFDEKNSTVSGIVKINVKPKKVSGSSLSLVPKSSLFLLQPYKDGKTTRSIISGLRIQGSESESFSLEISTNNGQVVAMTSNTLTLKTCRDGFLQRSSRCVCMKDTERHHKGIANCSPDNKNVRLKMGYWGGRMPNNNKEFITYPCPPHYCFFNQGDSDFVYNKSTICTSNRDSDSILCGSCKTNYSLVLGNEACIPDDICTSYSIYWGLPVFLVVVPILVYFLLYVSVDIFTSYLNSWLYFYQMLPFVVQTIEQFDSAMQFILSLASWEIKYASMTCFLKGMDNITKLAFNYLFPLYVLIIVIAFPYLVRVYTTCTGRDCFVRTNVFHAISTILVLCYANVILISFKVCRWVKIDKNIDVLFIQGSLYSTLNGAKDPHIPPLYYVLLVIAIIVIIFFVFALPVFLVFGSFFLRTSRFMRNFRNLYDIFGHCYRDGFEWFSAYYFIWRIAFLLLTSIGEEPGPFKQCWYQLLTVLCLVFFVYFQPYKNDDNLKWLNIVDTVVLSLLCMMTIMSSSRNSEASKVTKNVLELVIKIFSWLPMLYLVGLIAIVVWRRCKRGLLAARARKGYQDIDQPPSSN